MQNSFFSLYLLNGFSTIVDTAVNFAEIAGYTHRYRGIGNCDGGVGGGRDYFAKMMP